MIFRPLVKFKVTIFFDDTPSHRKALAITRIATFLDSVEELNIGGRTQYPFQFQYRFSPTLFRLFRALPAMRQLHTIQLSAIFLAETYLYCILSSPHLNHLILYGTQMPKISRLSPPNPNLRKLTLDSVSWDAVRPLIVHLAASLEYLEFRSCGFLFEPQSRPQLPSFPSLRELRHHHETSSNDVVLAELFRVSQVTHLHLFGILDSSQIDAFPKNLQHLSTEDVMLTQRTLGTNPMAQLMSLSILRSEEWGMDHHLVLSAFICNHFPRITSLHLDIPWSLRNVALVMARSQHNVRTMELSIFTAGGLVLEGNRLPGIFNDYLRNNTLPGVLQRLRLEVVQHYGKLELGLAECSRWIDDDVVHPVKSLGGSDLKSIDVSFVLPGNEYERERRIWKGWDKLPDGDWRIEGAVCDDEDTNARRQLLSIRS